MTSINLHYMPTISTHNSMHTSDNKCLRCEFTFNIIFDLINSIVYTSKGGVEFLLLLFTMKIES